MLPEQLSIKVNLNGEPTAGMFVLCTLHSRRKNDFQLVFGPTNDAGMIELTRADLRSEADKEKRLFPIDYGDPESDFTGEITVTALNAEAVCRALGAYGLFKSVTPYPGGYQQDLERALEILTTARGYLEIDVATAEPHARVNRLRSAV